MEPALKDSIYQHLSTVMDPELGVDIVSLGLIYDVSVGRLQTEDGPRPQAHILMTLTTPGCPLSHVIEDMIRQSLDMIPEIDAYRDVVLETTFDPPWIPDMMSEEAKAELGF
jgi:metal-sulfur cluster biosynthetic enzyme